MWRWFFAGATMRTGARYAALDVELPQEGAEEPEPRHYDW